MSNKSDCYQVLSECLILLEAQRRIMSNNNASLSPREGYEQAFANIDADIRVLREMMQETRWRET